MSPELFKNKPYSYESDVWALGCVLYEICALRPPFTALDMKGLYKRVIKGFYPKISSIYS